MTVGNRLGNPAFIVVPASTVDFISPEEQRRSSDGDQLLLIQLGGGVESPTLGLRRILESHSFRGLKMTRTLQGLAAVLCLYAGSSFACSFDTDCQLGSVCKKASGAIYGVCYGGISPGNKNDRRPVRDPLDINRTVGNTCSFDVDCGPGSVCAKKDGTIYGVCLKKK